MKPTLSLLLLAATTAALAEPTPAQKTFNALKRLEGTWTMGVGKKTMKVIYKVTGGGGTLIETQLAGTPMEMVTVYHLDGPDKLVLTHYCACGNQPSMALVPGATDKAFAFDFTTGCNMKPDDMHIHRVRYRMLHRDHVVSEWEAFAMGKPAGTETFDLRRAKA